eukprot:TRINITY_DN88735_c0_g1_i1.p1 TRINITY_DN88735_c0_g1~~TRINITY_DN88735_c0_g1_i1.p1  ORF type:complete len:698 (-),score=105.28 TRINITY_DN88735_c0_g1_i1:38-2131(-)
MKDDGRDEESQIEGQADDLCAPLAELDRFLKRASQALHSARCEMVALHTENSELKVLLESTPSNPKLELKPTLKPSVSGTSKDSDSNDPPELILVTSEDKELSDIANEWASIPALQTSKIQELVSARSREFCGDDDQGPDSTSLNDDATSQNEGERNHTAKDKDDDDEADEDLYPDSWKGASDRQMRHSPSSIKFSVDMFSKTRKRGKFALAVWDFLEDPESSRVAYFFSKAQDVIIQSSVILSVVQTTPTPPFDRDTSGIIQMCIDLFFLLELSARFSTCPSFRAFAKSIYNINDLIAGVLPLSLRAARLFFNANLEEGVPKYIVFCAAPVLRELKMLRRVEQFHLFLTLLENIADAVKVLMMLLMIVVLVFSSLIYIVEPEDNMGSMPKAMWLTVVTMTTVGYGDSTPDTVAGHLIISLLTLFSILYTAMPIGIIGNAFTQIWQDRDRILLMTKTRDILISSGYTAKDLPTIFRQYDGSGEGELDFEEFWLMVQDMNLGLNEQRAIEVFESIDRDGGGNIDEQEFVRAVFPTAFHDLYTRSSGANQNDDDNNDDDENPQSMSSKALSKVADFIRTVSGESSVSVGSHDSAARRRRQAAKGKKGDMSDASDGRGTIPPRRKSVRSNGSGFDCSDISSDRSVSQRDAAMKPRRKSVRSDGSVHDYSDFGSDRGAIKPRRKSVRNDGPITKGVQEQRV